MSMEAILAAIPHRPPFLLLDEILEWDEKRIVCRKEFTGDEFFFHGHYPEYPLTPGVLLCEAGMQAGAVLLSRHAAAAAPGSIPVATRMNDVRFKRMVRPGDTIEITAELTEVVSKAYFLTAKIVCGGTVAARFDFACALVHPQ